MPPTSQITRRRLLASAGVGAAAVGLGGGGFLAGRLSAEADQGGTGTVPFYGEHQAGIATAAQDRLHFAAFDLLTEDPAELRELLREWTRGAAEATAGEMVGDVNEMPPAPPDDTGETVGLLPSRLTVTFGFGPGLFEKRWLELGGKRPSALQPLPSLPGDVLNPDESDGDLDFEANVEGSLAAFESVKPLLDESDADLSGEIEADFKAVFNSLEPYRTGDGFVSYTELTNADTRALAREIDILAEELSQVPALIGGNG